LYVRLLAVFVFTLHFAFVWKQVSCNGQYFNLLLSVEISKLRHFSVTVFY